jgi:hypothetical protein
MIALIKAAALIAIAFTFSGCESIEAVRLKHPATGHVVQCGPYTGLTGYTYPGTVAIHRGCVKDFKDQGYVRVP